MPTPTEIGVKMFVLEQTVTLLEASEKLTRAKVAKMQEYISLGQYDRAQGMLSELAYFYSEVARRLGQIDILFPRADGN